MVSVPDGRPAHPLPVCATHELIRVIGDRWSVLVLIELGDHGPTRSSGLKRALDGVSQKVLTDCLRRLQDHGLVDRDVKATVPVTVTYQLTDFGQSFFAAFRGLRAWADEHADELEARRPSPLRTSARAGRQPAEPV